MDPPEPAITADGVAKELTPGAQRCVDALVKFLTADGTQAPLTVSVEAPWGAGKSSVMRKVQAQLASAGHPTVWFNPWKYEAGPALWAAFATAMERQLANRCGGPRARYCLRMKLAWERLNGKQRLGIGLWLAAWYAGLLIGLQALAGIGADGGSGLWSSMLENPWIAAILAPLIKILRDLGQVLRSPIKLDLDHLFKGAASKVPPDELHQFHEDFGRMLRVYVGTGKKGGDQAPVVYAFIDDLDRCEAPKAAELLQSLHLLMHAEGEEGLPNSSGAIQVKTPGMIYILGMDREKVAAAVAAKHERLLPFLLDEDQANAEEVRRRKVRFGHEFLEKFINLSLHLPALQEQDLRTFLENAIGMEERADAGMPPLHIGTGGALPTSSVDSLPSGGPEPNPDATGETGAASSSAKKRKEQEKKDRNETLERLEVIDEKIDATGVLLERGMEVADLLGRNPRRLKQFVNLLRLRMYLAGVADLLELNLEGSNDSGKLTVEQLAKLVALELALPGRMGNLREGAITFDRLKEAVDGTAAAVALIDLKKDQSAYDLSKSGLTAYFHHVADAAGVPIAPSEKTSAA